jgi:hypothetical protein
MAAPEQQEMKEGSSDQIKALFADKDAILVKQTMKGCIQECLGCEAKSEYKVSKMDYQYIDGCRLKEGAMTMQDEMYIIEESNCCLRICFQDGRPFVLKVSTGSEPGGSPIVEYRKPCGCPVMFTIRTDNGNVDCPCCCMLPEVTSFTPENTELNKSKYVCDMCMYVPKFMYSEGGTDIYKVRPETCCGGCCIVCKCGKGGYQIPFYFWDPASGEKVMSRKGEDNMPQITKVWAGMKKECCSTADNFAVFFPDNCSPERKAGILGMTMLVDFVFFEGRNQGE